jgi:hypothetical protein
MIHIVETIFILHLQVGIYSQASVYFRMTCGENDTHCNQSTCSRMNGRSFSISRAGVNNIRLFGTIIQKEEVQLIAIERQFKSFLVFQVLWGVYISMKRLRRKYQYPQSF